MSTNSKQNNDDLQYLLKYADVIAKIVERLRQRDKDMQRLAEINDEITNLIEERKKIEKKYDCMVSVFGDEVLKEYEKDFQLLCIDLTEEIRKEKNNERKSEKSN